MNRPESKTSLRQLIRLVAVIALPVALQNLLTTTGTMIDTMMIASLGEKSVGAVGLCAQYANLMYAGYWGFVGGGMLFFSQFWGAGNHKDICHSYGMTVCFMMISGVVCGSFAVFRPDLVMKLYTDSTDIQAIGILYLRIAGFSFPLQVIATAMSALLRSVERVRIPLIGGIVGVVTNCTTGLWPDLREAGLSGPGRPRRGRRNGDRECHERACGDDPGQSQAYPLCP